MSAWGQQGAGAGGGRGSTACEGPGALQMRGGRRSPLTGPAARCCCGRVCCCSGAPRARLCARFRCVAVHCCAWGARCCSLFGALCIGLCAVGIRLAALVQRACVYVSECTPERVRDHACACACGSARVCPLARVCFCNLEAWKERGRAQQPEVMRNSASLSTLGRGT